MHQSSSRRQQPQPFGNSSSSSMSIPSYAATNDTDSAILSTLAGLKDEDDADIAELLSAAHAATSGGAGSGSYKNDGMVDPATLAPTTIIVTPTTSAIGTRPLTRSEKRTQTFGGRGRGTRGRGGRAEGRGSGRGRGLLICIPDHESIFNSVTAIFSKPTPSVRSLL